MSNLRWLVAFASVLVLAGDLKPAMGQRGDCKNDRAAFIAHDPPMAQYDAKAFKDQFNKIGGSLSQFFSEIITAKLNSNAPADEIADYLGCVTDDDRYVTLSRRGPTGQEDELTNAPTVFFFPTANPIQAIATAYPIVGHPADQMWGIAPSRPVVQCFAKQNDHWFLVGDLGADFQLSTLSAYPLTSPIQGRTWVLLAGKAIGSANGILRLEVATCDGKTFTRKWVKTNIIEGEVEVYGDSVVLTYEKLDEQGRVVWYPTNHVRFTETLRVTPNGLE